MNPEIVLPIVAVFTLGACVGSFLNVVVYRLPEGISLVFPASRCPHCLTPLKRYENVPVLGWLWLRGCCRYCNKPISARYPLVEAATGILFSLVFLAFSGSVQTLGYWVFFSWLLALSLIDLDTMTLPNQLTQSGLVAGLGFQAIAGLLVGGTGLTHSLTQGILGAVLGVWLFDLIGLLGTLALGQAAMGVGDAKLAAMIGAWLGWQFLLMAVLLACTVGAVLGAAAIALKWIDRRQQIPFGPFLALGAALTTFWGETILSTYLQWFWPIGIVNSN